MKGVFDEPRPRMLPTIKVYDTPAYRKIFGSDPDSINNTFLIDQETDKFLNPELPRDFAYDNFDPEMVVLLFKTIMTDYQIRFNIRTDLDKDVYKVFSERYTKYIV